jgi:hypothetical protein
MEETSEINLGKNTTEVFTEKEDSVHKTEMRGPMRHRIGCTTWAHLLAAWCRPIWPPWRPSRRVLLRASIYTVKNPNPGSTELFVNQSTVAIEDKDFGTRLVSLFTSKREMLSPSSSPSTLR